jgi:hypothetical protein
VSVLVLLSDENELARDPDADLLPPATTQVSSPGEAKESSFSRDA